MENNIGSKIKRTRIDIGLLAEEVVPEADELAVLQAYHNGNPEYQPAISHEELCKELGL